jgi:flagellar basal-body rod protein FlgF
MARVLLNASRMEVSLYSAAAAMNATERWQDLIADNLSSASVPGTRRRDIVFSAVPAGHLGENGDPLVIPFASSAVNFQQGDIVRTGNDMDFAVEGAGFIEVQMPDGSKAYTRDGEFHLNAQGQLVTKRNYLVMGEGGPIQLDPNNASPLTVSADGQVSQGADVKGKISIAEFNDPNKLTMLGGGLYRNDQNLVPKSTVTSSLRQGFIEGAATNPMSAMASIITAIRLYESNEKVMQMQGDRMSKTISDLSGTSS